VTDKALDGLFLMVAEEGKKIRQDPMARTTDLLKKVLSSRDACLRPMVSVAYCLLHTAYFFLQGYRYPTRPLTLVYRFATSSQLMIFMKLST